MQNAITLRRPITTDIWLAIRRLPMARWGLICAWTAVLIYAASNSIVAMLVDIGAANPVEQGRNAITYMNLLLLGSLLSVIPMVILFRRDWTRANIARLTRRDWRMLTLSAFLSSALTPGLFFYALAHTSVTNVVLVSRIEPPLFLLAAWLVLNERVCRRTMAAGLIGLAGAVVMIGMRDGGELRALGTGEWATVAATLSYVASTLVTRMSLRDIPLGIFSIYRTIMGAAIYFVMVSAFFGPQVFRDILSPMLWQYIWLYAGVVIVLGQLTWNMALKYARASELSLATSFSPLAAILIAMVLLGESAGPGLLPGAALIVLAIAIGNGLISALRTGRDATTAGRVCAASDRERHKPFVWPHQCRPWPQPFSATFPKWPDARWASRPMRPPDPFFCVADGVRAQQDDRRRIP